MVICAHAADAELMGGATILAHRRLGWKSVLVHMTLGEKGHKSLGPDDYAEIKRSEATKAAEVFGADLEILPYLDGELPVNEDVQWHIADLIRKYRPTVIVTHWKGSLHTDHMNTHENVLAALFFAGLKTFVREYPNHYPDAVYFGENWEDLDGFVGEVYLDVSKDWSTYIEGVKSYGLVRGETASFRYIQWYEGASLARGAERGTDRGVVLMPYRTFYDQRKKVDHL
jgi:LmbE family N-acetylglucosaminyl deacetylase